MKDHVEKPENAPVSDHVIQQDRLASLAAETFSTEAGSELLDHLIDHFGVLNRTFVRSKSGDVCPIRAGIRDGERAAVVYLLKLLRHANKRAKKPTITLPLPK